MLYVNYSIDQLQGPLKHLSQRGKTNKPAKFEKSHRQPRSCMNDVLQDMWNTYLVFVS